MLISQRVANDNKFLKHATKFRDSKKYLIEIRQAIMESVKFIVGPELFNFKITREELRVNIFGKQSQDQGQKRVGLYEKYCRLPYPVMSVENHTGLFLFVALNKLCWNVFCIADTGDVSVGYIQMDFSKENSPAEVTTFYSITEEEVRERLGDEKFLDWDYTIRYLLGPVFMLAAEVLLFMNCRNIKHVQYTPTKKENAIIPKLYQPNYTYHVLDLFKEKKVHTSLENIKQDLCKPKQTTGLKRAVLVRGHFKTRKTGMFFWDHYTRNKHNAETHGIVDKDYRVHGPDVKD